VKQQRRAGGKEGRTIVFIWMVVIGTCLHEADFFPKF
jgi:hypothetical protein